jgi:hypothetical protein
MVHKGVFLRLILSTSFYTHLRTPIPALPHRGKEWLSLSPVPCFAACVGRRSTSATYGRRGYAKARVENERKSIPVPNKGIYNGFRDVFLSTSRLNNRILYKSAVLSDFQIDSKVSLTERIVKCVFHRKQVLLEEQSSAPLVP